MLYYDDKTFTDAEFSRYLVKQYTEKHFKYPKKVMENYTLKEVARLIGEIDLSFFSLYYLRDYFVASDDNDIRNVAPFHLEVWKELDEMFVRDSWDKEEFIQPRG